MATKQAKYPIEVFWSDEDAGYIAAALWFTVSSSFANPAGVLARALSDSYTGIRLRDAPAFWAAEVVGAVLAVGLSGWLFSRDS